MNRKYSIIPLIVLFLFTACKTTKTLTTHQTPASGKISDVIAQVQANQPQFSTANVSKMSMAFNMGNRKINVSASCKLVKDSAMHISIQPFMGIELFKVELTPTNMRVFDKMNGRYFDTDYGFFSQRFGVDVDYYSLQSLLFGQFFCIGNKNIMIDKCVLNQNNNPRTIDFETEKMKQTTEITAQNVIQMVLLIAKDSKYQLSTNYSNYVIEKGVNFPETIVLNATNQKTEASCEFSVLRVDFNTPLKLVASDTDRYSRGDIEQLLKK